MNRGWTTATGSTSATSDGTALSLRFGGSALCGGTQPAHECPVPIGSFLAREGSWPGWWMPADGKAVITVSEHGELSRYDLAAPRSWERLGPTTPRAILSVCWDEAGSSAWAGDYGGNVVRSDLTTRGAQLALTEGEATAHTDRVTVLEQSPDGTLLLTGSLDGSWALWNASTRALIRRVDVGAGVTSGCWLPQGAHCYWGRPMVRCCLRPWTLRNQPARSTNCTFTTSLGLQWIQMVSGSSACRRAIWFARHWMARSDGAWIAHTKVGFQRSPWIQPVSALLALVRIPECACSTPPPARPSMN